MTAAATRTISDEISGKPRVIENPLLAEHVVPGTYFWYNGFTSIGSWSCPAVITKVDAKKRRFRVRSLDDMREQNQWYDFDVDKDSSASRQTMRLVPFERVQLYLVQRKKRLKQDIAAKRRNTRAKPGGV